MEGWKTHPVEPVQPPEWWKKPIGQACPHGKIFYFVDGRYIRNTWDSDFVQGGNGYRYRFCPRGELWIDDSIPEDEWPYVGLHECHEAELMKKGMSYEQAHDRAKRLENQFRKLNRPGQDPENMPGVVVYSFRPRGATKQKRWAVALGDRPDDVQSNHGTKTTAVKEGHKLADRLGAVLRVED